MTKHPTEPPAATSTRAPTAALYAQCAHVLDLVRILNCRHGKSARNDEAAIALNYHVAYAILYATRLAQNCPQNGFLRAGDEITLPTAGARVCEPFRGLSGQFYCQRDPSKR